MMVILFFIVRVMANTPQINPDHPRIKVRTSEQQKYRDELANNLKADRALGEIGKLLAEDMLKKNKKVVSIL